MNSVNSILSKNLANTSSTSFLARVPRPLLLNVGLPLLGSLLIAIASQISFPLPFSPVPVTLQTLGVLLIGAIFGPWQSFLAVLFYLAQGALGLPVFARGNAGMLFLTGATAGYLFGFLLAAPLLSWLGRTWTNSGTLGTAFKFSLALTVIFTFGVAWLKSFLGLSLEGALLQGLWPFLPGEILKLVALASILPLVPRAR